MPQHEERNRIILTKLLRRLEGVQPDAVPALVQDLYEDICGAAPSEPEIERLFRVIEAHTGISANELRRGLARHRTERIGEARQESVPTHAPQPLEDAQEPAEKVGRVIVPQYGDRGTEEGTAIQGAEYDATALDALLEEVKRATGSFSKLLPSLYKRAYDAALSPPEVDELLVAIKRRSGLSMNTLRSEWVAYRDKRSGGDQLEDTLTITPDTLEDAQDLAMSPALLHKTIQAIKETGVYGEDENCGLLYLALVSGKTENPVSVLVKGRSSSGKSHLVSSVLKFIPRRGYYTLTSMSTRALVYTEIDFSHRHLIVYEEDGLASEELLYTLRTLLSEGYIRYLTVEKGSNGRLVGREINRPGPTGLITTMTRGLTREDNESRTFSLYVNDSTKHTLAVIDAISARRLARGSATVDTRPWHVLYEALPQLKVHIPYVSELAKHLYTKGLPEDMSRLRRDYNRLLSFIDVVTLLHHPQRETDGEYLVSTLEDYALVYHLVAHSMARSVHFISPRALTLARAVSEIYKRKVEKAREEGRHTDGLSVSVRELAQYLRWDKRTVQRWVEQAEAGGLTDVKKEDNRLALRPVEGVSYDESAFRLLPEPELLARKTGEKGGFVHPLSGEYLPLHLPYISVASGTKTPANTAQDDEKPLVAQKHASRAEEPALKREEAQADTRPTTKQKTFFGIPIEELWEGEEEAEEEAEEKEAKPQKPNPWVLD